MDAYFVIHEFQERPSNRNEADRCEVSGLPLRMRLILVETPEESGTPITSEVRHLNGREGDEAQGHVDPERG